MKNLIILELNEVPYRVLDHYVGLRPQSNLAKIFPKSTQYLTSTEDTLTLDPWTSWPTLHRGVPDTMHGILHLGQVLKNQDDSFPPIWKILKKSGINVGVFGSLHTSTVPDDFTDYSFYVPDYFANDLHASPKSLLPFQELNLRMTRDSARNVSRKLPIGQALKFLATAPMLGVTAKTAATIGKQLVGEVSNKNLKVRRRNLQAVLSTDLFMKQLRTTKPQFATFYTNHVAAAMHRYWAATFPKDYATGTLEADWVEKYGMEIVAAMDTFDNMLGQVLSFTNKNPDYSLAICSSMGQGAVPAEHTDDFLTIADVPKFMKALGVDDSKWEMKPAMVPCQCVVVANDVKDRFIEKLKSLSIDGNSMQVSRSPVAPMSFDEGDLGFFQLFIQFDSYAGGKMAYLNGQPIDFATLGLGTMAHEDGVNCTARHVPEGSLIVYSPGKNNSETEFRKKISTTDFVPSVLSHFNLTVPAYLPGTSSIAF